MKKIFIMLSLIFNVILCDLSLAKDTFTVYQYKFPQSYTKDTLNNLSFAENQVFHKIYSKDTVEDRIERLELQVYGAIQDGKILARINNLKNSVTNVSQGGKGLQYAVKLFDLAGNSMASESFKFDNNTCSNNYNNAYSFRLPSQKQYRSSRVEYNNYGNYDSFSPYNNFAPNFSIGTGVKIIKDD